jgi:hypothetical protein
VRVREQGRRKHLAAISLLDWESAVAARSLSSSGESARTACQGRKGQEEGNTEWEGYLEDVLGAFVHRDSGGDVHGGDAISFVVLRGEVKERSRRERRTLESFGREKVLSRAPPGGPSGNFSFSLARKASMTRTQTSSLVSPDLSRLHSCVTEGFTRTSSTRHDSAALSTVSRKAPPSTMTGHFLLPFFLSEIGTSSWSQTLINT